jgi:hypothetical protein
MSFGPNSSFAPVGDASFGLLGRIPEHPSNDGDDDFNQIQDQSAEEPVPEFKIPIISIKVSCLPRI